MAITLSESKPARFGTLCSLYFSQGVPWAFIAVAFVAYLVGHDTYDISDEGSSDIDIDGDIAMDVRKTDFGADDRPLSILNNGSSPTVDSFLSIRNDRHNGCVLVHR